MDRSDTVSLISITYTSDSIGQRVPTETEATVYCNVKSVGYGEWHQASANGITPEYVVEMFAPEYSGQTIVKYNNVRYAVYRTYRGKNETLELYLQKKAGV